jgi:hypothetical protein
VCFAECEYVPSLLFAVAPCGSLDEAVLVGAVSLFDADGADATEPDFAAEDAADEVDAGAPVEAGAVEAAMLDEDFVPLSTPPWPEHAPRPDLLDVVPSWHVVVPLDAVLAAALASDEDELVDVSLLAVSDFLDFLDFFLGVPVSLLVPTVAVSRVAELVLADASSFFTPPWPLHAPRPLAAEVVPSEQVTSA